MTDIDTLNPFSTRGVDHRHGQTGPGTVSGDAGHPPRSSPDQSGGCPVLDLDTCHVDLVVVEVHVAAWYLRRPRGRQPASSEEVPRTGEGRDRVGLRGLVTRFLPSHSTGGSDESVDAASAFA